MVTKIMKKKKNNPDGGRVTTFSRLASYYPGFSTGSPVSQEATWFQANWDDYPPS